MPIRNPEVLWNFPDLVSVPADFQLAIGGTPLVANTLYRRGLTSLEKAQAFLDPDQYTPCSPAALPGLPEAADRILQAINEKEQILIWGDFDVDGQTSTALLTSSLDLLGARVSHHIPIRAEESHGVSIPVLADKILNLSPSLIITCDTGIDAVEAVEFAHQSGVDVIITDHHQLPPALPNALAVINPNTLPAGHALYHLPGVGVAYKLMEDVYARFSRDPSFLLDLVALGIVADVATQTGDTRYLLQKGLEQLRKSPRPGLLEIYKTNNLKPDQINEEHIGFVIGPRLNALGRLDDANSAVDFFTTEDPVRASRMAARLEELNKTRQLLTEKIFQDAENMISAYPELVEEYPILVLQGSPQWNPGVIGIVASRLVDRYHKPVIMLSQDGDQARGSARSIPGVPISKIISASEELLTSHGGHPMAAGMSLPLINVSQFRRSLADNYRIQVGDSIPAISIQVDAEISFQDINESSIRDFHRLAPFGAGNPKLIFATRGVITDDSKIKPIGRTGNHRKITFSDANGDQNDFLWWNSSDLSIPVQPLDIAYSLEMSTYRNQPQIQSTLLHLRQSPDAPVYLPESPAMDLIDLRRSDDPLAAIIDGFSPSRTLVWAEFQEPAGLPSLPRSKLSKCDQLIIWTSPPNKYVLNQALKKASPNQVVLVGIHPGIATRDDFIQALLGLLKHLDKTGKSFDLTRFSEVLALPENVIEMGIDWIQNQGDYNLDRIEDGILSEGPGNIHPSFTDTDTMLRLMLREVQAYRKYFINAHIRAIL